MAPSERLKIMLKTIGITQDRFADEVGLTQGAVSDIIRGKTKGISDPIAKLCGFLYNINPGWLLTGKGEMYLPGKEAQKPQPKTDPHNAEIRHKLVSLQEELGALTELFFDEKAATRGVKHKKYEHKDYIEVPLIGEIAAGTPMVAEQNVERIFCIPNFILKRRGAYFALKVRGDSMIGASIHSGDVAFLRQVTSPRDQIREGDIVAALIEGEATLKRIHFKDDSIDLIPANPDYDTIQIERSQLFLVQGVLVGVWRYFRGFEEDEG